MIPRARTAVLAVVAVLAAVAAPLVALAPAAHADLGFQAPVVGSCYSYTAKVAAKPHDTSAPVPCTGAHTGQVVAVVEVSEKSLKGNQQKAFVKADKACEDARDAALGLDVVGRALTAYELLLFAPTKDQVAAGARWIRCDVALVAGTTLAPLPSPLVTDLSTPAADAVVKCYDAKDRITTCAQRHVLRAVYAAKARGAYPRNAAAARRIAEPRCGQAAQFSPKQRFAWVFPTPTTWAKERKFVICLAVTKK